MFISGGRALSDRVSLRVTATLALPLQNEIYTLLILFLCEDKHVNIDGTISAQLDKEYNSSAKYIWCSLQ